MVKRVIIKAGIFCVILGIILSALSEIFVLKTTQRGKLQQGLYKTDDSYDVALLGSSHMNGGIDPNVLWEKYGITSFNYATGGQPMDVTYYLLNEVLKKHKVSIAVVDTYYLGMTNEYGETGFVSNVLDNMNFSWNKLNAIVHCTSPNEWMDYLFPVLKYHYRWSSLTLDDFFFDSASVYYTKGFAAGTNKYGKQLETYADTDEKAEIPEKNLYYLNKIIQLSKTENFQLILTNMPCDYSDSEKDDGWIDNCEALFNTVADLAKQNGIPFLDYDDEIDEIGLDFSTDMNNSGHLNIWGACKVSMYFGQYLKQNYQLADHRNDSSYAQWESDYPKSQAASVLT